MAANLSPDKLGRGVFLISMGGIVVFSLAAYIFVIH